MANPTPAGPDPKVAVANSGVVEINTPEAVKYARSDSVRATKAAVTRRPDDPAMSPDSTPPGDRLRRLEPPRPRRPRLGPRLRTRHAHRTHAARVGEHCRGPLQRLERLEQRGDLRRRTASSVRVTGVQPRARRHQRRRGRVRP